MKRKLLHFLSAAILAMAATAASADPAVIGTQVPGSDPSSEPCTPTERTDDYHTRHFAEDLSQSNGKTLDVVLFGDSITDFWPHPNLSFDGDASKTINMGIGSDRVQNLLWRLRNGALDNYTAKFLTLMVGINNGHQKRIDHNEPCDRPEDVAESIRLMLNEMAARQPDAKILLMPILPYAFESKYFAASEINAMSDAVNDYILQFVDNKRVFWVDFRSQYLNPDGTCNKQCYRPGDLGGYDAQGQCLHPNFSTYPDIFYPAVKSALERYRDGAAGTPHVAPPSISFAKAAPNVDGAGTATITVNGIFLGTDANAVPVTSYSMAYELDDGPKTQALANQSLTRNSFVIPNVALGAHTCKVTVTTADNKELVTSIDFTMTEPWVGEALPATDGAVRTDGTLLYAYATGAYTLNGVPFAAAGNNNASISSDISWPYSSTSGSPAPDGVASGAYRDFLTHCWWANQGDKEVTLKNLTPGHAYLVQVFGYRNYNNDDKAYVWIKESYWDPNYIKVLGNGWERGGVLTGTITATEATKTFTITSDGNYAVNGIQVRDLGASGVPIVVQPRVGSVTATTNGTAATVFLSGIAMGTDDAGDSATSYTVSCSLDDAAPVTALSGQSGTSAQFTLSGLADGEHTCAVTITTDKNKTSAAKSVFFRIGEPPAPVVAPSIGAVSVSTNGTTATISLSGIETGTDNAGVAAISYSVSCSLTNAPAATVLSNQSGATASFDIADLADGVYSCTVTITTDKNKTSAAQSVSFRIGTPPPAPVGWTAEPMDAAGAKFSTEGALVYAYGTQGQTVNGVAFARALPLASTHSIAFTPEATGFDGSLMNEGVSDNGYGLILGNGWTWTDPSTDTKAVTLTLKDLTPGERYLVQILSHTHWSGSMLVSANGCEAQHVYGSDEAGGKYGALMTGTFTASAETQDVEILFSGSNGDRPINAVQVRALGEGGVVVIAPSIGSAAANASGSNATVTLSGIVLGTDDEGAAATSYAVSYALNGGTAVAALSNQSGSTASFGIENLADGSYTCEVTITTDKGKTATKSVSFAISTSGGGGGGGSAEEGWTGGAADAEGAVFRTDGTLLYAYAVQSVTVNGIAFAADADLNTADTAVSPDLAQTDGNSGSESVTGDFGTMLKNSWEWANSTSTLTITLKGLTAGKRYLVQVLAHNKWSDALISAGDLEPMAMRENNKYGASLVCVFDATGGTEDIAVKYSGPGGWRALNAIQVRELGAGGGGGSDETPVYTLTIPAKTGLVLDSVTTNGIAVAAASGNAYSIVSNDTATITFAAASGYEIVGGNPVVLTVTGDRMLADAEYPAVQQTGGGGSGGDFELGWTVSPMSADGDTIVTNGVLVYAYATQNRTVNTVEFKRGVANLSVIDMNIAVSPAFSGHCENMARPDGNWSDYGWMLVSALYWDDTVSGTTQTLQLGNLTIGHAYLVQIVSHSGRSDEDGMTISANGTEPQYIGPHGDDQTYKYGASIVGTFVATAATEDVRVTYSGNATGLRPINAIQVRDLGEVAPPVVNPAIESVSAAVSGSTATIVLGGVEMGTDGEGVAATSYAVSYALDGGEPVEKLWNQTGRSAWFNVTNLADGAYTVEVTIATDAGGVAAKSVSFTVDSTAPATTAWILTEMDAAGACVRTDGELLYAHAPHQLTVNGVPFVRTPWIADANFSASPVEADACWGWMMNEGILDGEGYGFLLGHAWFWDTTADDVEVEITLEGLTPGKNYLVQLFSHNWGAPNMRFSVEDSDGHPVGTHTDVEIQDVCIPYRYGTTAVGFFTASDSTQSFKIAWADSTGSHPLNALQVRDLGLAVPVVVEPSIGDASAAVDGATAVVTLSGVVKGTGDDCEPASSYSVAYALDGGAPVTVLEGRTGATAAFALAGLADGDHVCVVSIATDKGKTSEAKTVRIEIGSEPFEWKTEPMGPAGETICTNGVRVWAYCRGADGGQVTANGVSFTSYEDLNATRLKQKEIRLPFSVSPEMLLSADDWGDEGVAGGLGKILSNAFYAASDGSRTFTLTGLKADHTYLVQLIMHKGESGTTATSPLLEVADYVQFGQTGADDTWKLGGSLIGTFLAESETHTFTVDYDGDFSALNAIQLRDLGVTVAKESDPSVASVSGKRKATSATVTLSGVAMGTDANRHPATSYAVSYSLDNGANWTTVLTGQNGETASFELAGLEYRTYVCEVKIETDVGKSTAPQSVTLAFAKADGLAIVLFDVGKEALAFDMGSESSVRALLPNAADIYCTLVASTNLADVVWTPAGPSLAWRANELPLDDESGWTWAGVDTTDPVRFFRVALTAAPLAADDEVVFK